MRNQVERDLAAEWSDLLDDWHDAIAACERADSATVDQARARLTETKRRMDELLRTGLALRAARPVERNELVLGFVEETERGVKGTSPINADKPAATDPGKK